MVRDLLERERTRRDSMFYGASPEDDRRFMTVTTSQGTLTAIEIPGKGFSLLRDDKAFHFFTYQADEKGWHYILGEGMVRDFVRSQPQSPPGAVVAAPVSLGDTSTEEGNSGS